MSFASADDIRDKLTNNVFRGKFSALNALGPHWVMHGAEGEGPVFLAPAIQVQGGGAAYNARGAGHAETYNGAVARQFNALVRAASHDGARIVVNPQWTDKREYSYNTASGQFGLVYPLPQPE